MTKGAQCETFKLVVTIKDAALWWLGLQIVKVFCCRTQNDGFLWRLQSRINKLTVLKVGATFVAVCLTTRSVVLQFGQHAQRLRFPLLHPSILLFSPSWITRLLLVGTPVTSTGTWQQSDTTQNTESLTSCSRLLDLIRTVGQLLGSKRGDFLNINTTITRSWTRGTTSIFKVV